MSSLWASGEEGPQTAITIIYAYVYIYIYIRLLLVVVLLVVVVVSLLVFRRTVDVTGPGCRV